jgi:DNA phosphorothioation-dependent restriction protein DptH
MQNKKIEKKSFIFDNIDDTENILIFDYDGIYKDLDHTHSKIAFLEVKDLSFNPLSLHGNKKLLPLLTGNKFKFTMAKYAHLRPSQQGALINAINKAYEENEIVYNEPISWINVAPSIKDVISQLDRIENAEAYTALDKLIALNVAISTKTTSLLDFIQGVKIIDLSKIDSNIQDLIVAIVLDALYLELIAHNPSNQNRKIIQIEERDNLQCYHHDSLVNLLDIGEEYGITILMK